MPDGRLVAYLGPLFRRASSSGLAGPGIAIRLLSEAGWASHPGYAEVGIERPIFVTGLPRTGTTALHRLHPIKIVEALYAHIGLS